MTTTAAPAALPHEVCGSPGKDKDKDKDNGKDKDCQPAASAKRPQAAPPQSPAKRQNCAKEQDCSAIQRPPEEPLDPDADADADADSDVEAPTPQEQYCAAVVALWSEGPNAAPDDPEGWAAQVCASLCL